MINHFFFFAYNSEGMQTDGCLSNSELFTNPFYFLYEQQQQQQTFGPLSNDFKLVGSQSLEKTTNVK